MAVFLGAIVFQFAPMWTTGLLARIARWRSGISVLEEADMWRLYIVCSHRKETVAKGGRLPSRDFLQRLLDRPPPFAEQKALVHAEVQVQALRSLRAVHDASAPEADQPNPPFTLVGANRAGPDRRPHSGVRLVGSARPGDLVCFFPGVVFTQSDVWHLPGGMQALAGANAFARHSGTIVSASHLHLLPARASANRFALGHEINHPHPKTQPNVIPFGLDIELAALPEELMAVLPTAPFSAVATRSEAESQRSLDDMFRSSVVDGAFADDRAHEYAVGSTYPTLVMIALREIRNEELFLNYRLNPSSKARRPDWYTPVSEIEDELRWRG
jgi:hypothetical protein